jgi:hypothetical protein
MTTFGRRHLLAALTAIAVTAWSPAARGQMSTTLSEKDRTEILALLATYRTALLGCHAEQYADLFATPGGYFSSGPRGEVRTREDLIDMTLGYDRCMPNPPAPGHRMGAGGRQRAHHQQPRRRLLRRRLRQDTQGLALQVAQCDFGRGAGGQADDARLRRDPATGRRRSRPLRKSVRAIQGRGWPAQLDQRAVSYRRPASRARARRRSRRTRLPARQRRTLRRPLCENAAGVANQGTEVLPTGRARATGPAQEVEPASPLAASSPW